MYDGFIITSKKARRSLPPVCACQLVGHRHLIGDASLLHILQHGMHGYIEAPCTVAWRHKSMVPHVHFVG